MSLGSLMGWAFAAAVAVGLGVGAANAATHYARAWYGTSPNTEFWIGLGGFSLGGFPLLLVLFVLYFRSTQS